MVTINEMGEFTTYDGADAMFAYVDDPRTIGYAGSDKRRSIPCRAVVRSDGMRYPSAKAAASEMAELRGITRDTAESSIRRALNPNDGKQSAYGYGWSYE